MPGSEGIAGMRFVSRRPPSWLTLSVLECDNELLADEAHAAAGDPGLFACCLLDEVPESVSAPKGECIHERQCFVLGGVAVVALLEQLGQVRLVHGSCALRDDASGLSDRLLGVLEHRCLGYLCQREEAPQGPCDAVEHCHDRLSVGVGGPEPR